MGTVKYSGPVASFHCPTEATIRSLKVHFSPKQLGSGDPSPENVRPISGWTGCNVSRTGKNLLDIHGTVYNTQKSPEGTINLADYSVIDHWAYNGYVRPSRETTTIQNNSITIVTSDGAYGVGLVAKVKAGQKYTFQATHNGNVIFGYYTANCSYISHEPGGINTTYTVTIPAGVEYIIILFRGTGAGTFTISDIQLEPGEIASTYEPFKSSTTYPITWEDAGTVYGGTVNPVTGELVVDRAMVDLGALNYSRTSGSDGTFVFTTSGFAGKKTGIANIISDCLLTTTITSWTNAKPNNSICGSATSTTVVIRADNYENANDLKTALSGHHAVYELVTPITYQLTPQEIRTLLGTNNIWSNADYVEVEYDLHETQNILARKQFIIANQPHIEKPAAAPLQNFATDMVAPLKECKVHFRPVQEGTGDPSPENVRAISGWAGLTTYYSGENLYIPNINNKGYIIASGAIKVDTTSTYTDLIPVTAGETYSFKCITARVKQQSTNRRLHGYDSNGNWIKQIAFKTTDAATVEDVSLVETIPSDISYIRVSFRNQDTNVRVAKENVISVNWSTEAGTIYGGYVDLVTGEVVQTHYLASVLKSQFGNQMTSSSSGMSYRQTISLFPDTASGTSWVTARQQQIFNYGKIANPWRETAYGSCVGVIITQNDVGTYMRISEDIYQALSENDRVEISYKLATPITYQIGQTTLKTLRGTNNIWAANGGDNIEIAYWKH